MSQQEASHDTAEHTPQLSTESSPSIPAARFAEPEFSEQPKFDADESRPVNAHTPRELQHTPNLIRAATLNMGFLPRLRRKGTEREFWDTARTSRPGLQWDLAKSVPLKDLLPMLGRLQKAFFDKLDNELDKVEAFYLEREKEMRARYEYASRKQRV